MTITTLEEPPQEDLVCPFCGEGEFDKIGLKGHLVYGDCKEYEEVTERPRFRFGDL